MCHTPLTENEQIDKCVENGMPTKIIKTVRYTMRKRAKEEQSVVENAREGVAQKRISVSENGGKSHDALVTSLAHGYTHSMASPADKDKDATSLFTSGTPKSGFEIPPLCGRFRRRQQSSVHNDITNIGNFMGESNPTDTLCDDDILAVATQLTKRVTIQLHSALKRLQKGKVYTLLTKTTQPAHIVVIGTISFVLLTVWPELFDDRTDQVGTPLMPATSGVRVKRPTNALLLVAYLAAFSTHFGAQIWMTFVSGLSLYFALPRHVFGQCQQILFPKYFALNAVLSVLLLILHVKCVCVFATYSLSQYIQLAALALNAAIELLVRLYLAPPMLRLMHEKYKIESTIGSGREIASLVQGDLVQCPHYQRIHKTFRRIHMIVAIGNVVTLVASCLHLYYLAARLQLS